jgi:hypothetical protein
MLRQGNKRQMLVLVWFAYLKLRLMVMLAEDFSEEGFVEPVLHVVLAAKCHT